MLAAEFEKQFIWFGENVEKCIVFLVPIEKELITIDKNGEEITNSISYRLQFIDSLRFMTSLLSNLVNNLAEEISKIKWKYGHNKKNVKLVELNKKIASIFLNTQSLKII